MMHQNMFFRTTQKELTETSSVLEETIEDLRPAVEKTDLTLTRREKDIVRLLAKFDLHTSPALISEILKRGLL